MNLFWAANLFIPSILENCNEKMEKDAEKYLTDAEENKDIQLLATGNKLWKAVKVNIATIKTLEAEIQNLKKKA